MRFSACYLAPEMAGDAAVVQQTCMPVGAYGALLLAVSTPPGSASQPSLGSIDMARSARALQQPLIALAWMRVTTPQPVRRPAAEASREMETTTVTTACASRAWAVAHSGSVMSL
jgi:hypothetical protein